MNWFCIFIVVVAFCFGVGWLGGPAMTVAVGFGGDVGGGIGSGGSDEEYLDLEDPEGSEGEEGRCVGQRPILLVHGFNSAPGMWQAGERSFVAWLEGEGYATDLIGLYQYSGGDAGAYNNQGSVVEVSLGMRQAVLDLSQAAVACGGVERVGVVAHSMGGLVVRQYLQTWLDDHRIDVVASVGSPYQGSWLLEGLGGLGYWERQLLSEVSRLLVGADIDSLAARDLRPGSDYLRESYMSQINPSVQVNTMYGDVRVAAFVSLFGMRLGVAEVGWLGDGVVAVESAVDFSDQDLDDLHAWGYVERVEVNAVMGRGLMGGWVYEFSAEDFSGQVWHTALLDNWDLRGDLLGLLRGGL